MVTLTTTSATRRLEMALGATKVGEKARNFVFDHVGSIRHAYKRILTTERKKRPFMEHVINGDGANVW